MDYRRVGFMVLLAMTALFSPVLLPGESGSVWQVIFNGNDLTGWSTTGNWKATANGTLSIEPRPGEEGWQRYADYLWTDKKYADFILQLEYKIPPKGNSGIFLGVKNKKNPVYEGIEIQILDSHEKKDALTPHDCGGVIGIRAPESNATKPAGEWNKMQISCRGDHLLVNLNGHQIIDLKMSEKIGRLQPLAGYIGLQDHGLPLEFRNIKICKLSDQ